MVTTNGREMQNLHVQTKKKVQRGFIELCRTLDNVLVAMRLGWLTGRYEVMDQQITVQRLY